MDTEITERHRDHREKASARDNNSENRCVRKVMQTGIAFSVFSVFLCVLRVSRFELLGVLRFRPAQEA